MVAAQSACDETISSLLSWGASPDKTAHNDKTALISAIESKCPSTISLLVPVTQVNLGKALYCLAMFKVDVMTEELTQLVERAAKDKNALIEGILDAAKFGSSKMLDMMITQYTMDDTIPEEGKQRIWMEVVKSDSEATVSALLPFLPNPPLEAITLARERGVPGVIRVLLPDTKVEGEEEREALRDAVLANTAKLLDQTPRDVEFTYNQNMKKLRPLIARRSMVPYATLLKELHLPKVHVNDKEPMVCPSDCSQQQNCHRIKEILGLVNIIKHELGKRSTLFEGIEVSMIGSTREGSRAFFYDEVDIHLSLNHDLQNLCFFDVEEQALKKRGNSRAKNSDIAKYFNDSNSTFLPKRFFYDFVTYVHSIISTMKIPDSFSMLPLTTSFGPCTKCMTLGLRGLQVMRCRHKSNCEQHKRCRCEEPSKCECLDECGCREYTSPSLTWSKVGVVLHLQWREEDGTLFTIDCDLNCPTWPTHTRYDGRPIYIRYHLMTERPVGWLEEFYKQEDLSSVAATAKQLTSKSWPVKFRLITRDAVLPSQVTTLGHSSCLESLFIESIC